MWGMIATWRMAKEGLDQASTILSQQGTAGDAIEVAIKEVENFPYYKSVGYGGLPNKEMEVELDAAYMDGTTFDIGAIGALKDFANPISIARSLSRNKVNNLLVGSGAEAYAHKAGFERKNMLTERAKTHFKNRVKDLQEFEISPYSGHDTVGMVSLDSSGKMVAGTSTSGLFMKERGRVGDSPIIGSGLYVDSEVGGASATGLGEDLMKGVVSYEVVRLMKEGLSPQESVEKVTFELDKELTERRGSSGDISIVAMNNKGEWGVASNIDNFSFAVVTQIQENTVYRTIREGNQMVHTVASEEWMENYLTERMKPLEEK